MNFYKGSMWICFSHIWLWN